MCPKLKHKITVNETCSGTGAPKDKDELTIKDETPRHSLKSAVSGKCVHTFDWGMNCKIF